MTTAPELTTTTAPPYPYPEDGVIDYDRLDFDPFELEPLPESMEQNPIIVEMVYTLVARFASFEWRGEVFIDHNSDICYDRRNLNVRIRPDVFLAFDVPEGLDIHARSLVPALGGRQAAGLGSGSGFQKHRRSGHRSQTAHLRRDRRPGVLALRPQRRRPPRRSPGRRPSSLAAVTNPSN